MLETETRLLKRVASEQVSEFYKRLHEEEGVEIRLGSKVVALQGNSQVKSVVCDDDSHSGADMVIIGVGVIPNTELASEAGLVVENGIVAAKAKHPCQTSGLQAIAPVFPIRERAFGWKACPMPLIKLKWWPPIC